ncbi:MAG: oligosaccharide flippase family protein [Microgenomates group bacterium]
MHAMSFQKHAISGFSWNALLKIATSLLTIAKVALTARLLTPTDFGIFSLIAIALGLTESTTQTGINLTILQSKQSIHYFLNTAWVIAIARGFLIGILMVFLGVLLGNYYDEPSLPALTALAALIPVIKGFINPSIVTLHKELKFFHDSIFRFSLAAAEAILAVLFSFFIGSPVALVLALIFGALFEVAISFSFFVDRPAFNYIPSRAKAIFANAKGLSISSALNYVYENIDDFIIGKILGTHTLGLYHNAYALTHKATADIAKITHHATIPILSQIHDDGARLYKAFSKSAGITFGFALVASIPFFVWPEFVVLTLLGDQWLGIVPLVPWLAGAGLLHAVSILGHSVLLATRQYSFLNIYLAVSLGLLITLLIVMSQKMGANGVGPALVLSRLLSVPVLCIFIYKTFDKYKSST